MSPDSLIQRLLPLVLLFLALPSKAQECEGGALHTKDNYLYGRFEVAMQSAEGSGVVSSFFLYNIDVGCNWPEENNEIDLEMTGNKTRLVFTTHYPGPWYYTDTLDAGFDPHAAIHDYAIEWEPGIVRWFVDGELANVQDQDFVDGLIHPMRVVMNLYASEYAGDDWAGPWDPAVMPLQSMYEYVRVYDYTPGSGDHGTDNNFTLLWEDEFTSLDTGRWEVDQYETFGGNRCIFKESSVDIVDEQLILHMVEPDPDPPLIPVTFAVNTDTLLVTPADVINLNGTFNAWCGNCEPMSFDGEVWSTTLMLPPGKHEYVFARNLWEEIGQPAVESACDFYPCDEYANYGFTLTDNMTELVLDTLCWDQCLPCPVVTGIGETPAQTRKTLVRVTDILGRESHFEPGKLLLYHFSDGSIEKRIDQHPPYRLQAN